MPYNPQIHHRRSIRLKGYDYSKEGLYFITICCEDRKHRFGEIITQNTTQTPTKPPSQKSFSFSPQMHLNEFGKAAYLEWMRLPERFPNIELDAFQIMPNHIHGIISILAPAAAILSPQAIPAPRSVRATLAVAPKDSKQSAPKDSKQSAPKDSGQSAQIDSEQSPQIELGQPQGLPRQDILLQNKNLENNLDLGQPQGLPRRGSSIGDIIGAYKSLVTNACIHISNTQNKRLGTLWQRNYYEHIIRTQQAYQNISNYIKNNPAQWHIDKFY